MKRKLLKSTAFVRSTRRAVKKHPHAASELRQALRLLENNAHHPKLRTHKLKGKLRGQWACTVSFDLRIVFAFVEHEGSEAILLASVGTHEEVY